MKHKNTKIDKFFRGFFAFFAFFAIVFLMIITFYIFFKGLQPFVPGNEYGSYNFWDFLTGMEWNSSNGHFGILYMILGTLFSTLIAITIAIPIALLTAVAISELLPHKLASFLTGVVELLAGIPSIIFGIFGLIVVVPLLEKLSINPYPQGQSMFAVALVLLMMILPTIIIVSSTALNAVPDSFREASLGLGASKLQTTFLVCIPAARRGILAGVILGIGRAIGETMAVLMVAGNVGGGFKLGTPNEFVFQLIRPLTANIGLDISYASGLELQLLFSTALILFVFIFILNVTVQQISKGGKNGK